MSIRRRRRGRYEEKGRREVGEGRERRQRA